VGVEGEPQVPSGADYADLKRLITGAGLFERQPRYYVGKVAVTFGLFALTVVLILLSHSLWAAVPAAALLGIVSAQIGFLLHDAAHRQIFPPGKRADGLLLLTGPLLTGVSGAWWKQKHDLHHAHPNDTERDPDVRIGLLAFTPDQARTKSRLVGLVTRFQAYLIFPLLMFESLQLRAASVKYLVTKRPRLWLAEMALFAVNVAFLCGLFLYTLGWPAALVALFVREAVAGVYVGSVFAPNHKGMPMIGPDSELSFLQRQVITSRNVRGSALVDWWYGGLNYQIEHHLFPNLPRNRLREAQKIAKSFCIERGVPYYETTLLNSYVELFRSLDESSAPLREPA
jgi:fatty acid desaturase